MEKCSLCIGCIVLVVIELKGLDAAFYEKREVSVSLRFLLSCRLLMFIIACRLLMRNMRLVDGAPNIRTWNPKVKIDIDDPGT